MAVLNQNNFRIYKWALLIFAISFFSLPTIGQKKVKGIVVNKQPSTLLSKGFKKVEVYEIDVADLSKHAKANGKSTFDLNLELAGIQPFAITIAETNLLADDYQLIVADGTNLQISSLPNCKTYAGTLLNDSSSAVFLTISDKTIYGFIKSGKKQYHIEPFRYFEKDAAINNFVFYEAADVIQSSGQTCGVTELDQKVAAFSGSGSQPLGEATGLCKVTDVGIGSDRSMVDKYGSAALVEEHNISVMNMVVGLYRNAQIGTGYLAFRIRAQYVSVNTTSDPLRPAYNGRDADSVLLYFSRWAVETGFSNTPDLVQMWTARDFGQYVGPGPADYNYNVIGLAFLNAVCKTTIKFQILEAFTGLSGMSLGVLAAHEIGHNFGAVHDNGGSFIMGSSLNPVATAFSSASLQAMTSFSNTLTCLSGCLGVTIPEFNTSNNSICTGSSVTFDNASVSEVPFSSFWQFPGGNPASSTAGSPTVRYFTPGRKTASLNIGNQSISKEIFVADAPKQACRTLTPRNADKSGLLSFSFSSIGYTATGVFTGGVYRDLACSLNTKLTPGANYTITAGLGFPLTDPIKSKLQVFLDYNNDGDFLDATELLYTGTDCKFGTDSFNFAAPAFVNLTDTWLRLRVVASPCNVVNSDGCSLSGNANIFDFAVYFERPTACILYVNANATGNNTGSSWANAFTNLQAAINGATCPYGSQIWVARGTYYPDEGAGMVNNDRNMRFALRNDLAIYGGFAGTETMLSQRNLKAAPSILSGEIQQDNDPLNNTISILSNLNVNATAVLDGFTIQSGSSTGNGGAMVNSNAAPTIRHCIFHSNLASSWAGAVYNAAGSNPIFINCVFSDNVAAFGGAIFNVSSSPEFMNCTFAVNNSASGAAIWSQTNSFAKLTNCIVWGNTGNAALVNTVTSPYTVTNSLTQEVMAGSGNLTANPLFVNMPQGDFRLTGCSPAINTGTSVGASVQDILGWSRPAIGGFDMGAYERQAAIHPFNIYVDASATGNNDGTSWANAYNNLQAALNDLNLCATSNLYLVAIAAGTYTATAATTFNFDKINTIIFGGYPTGGGFRNATANPVIIKGEVRVLKSLDMDGIRVQPL